MGSVLKYSTSQPTKDGLRKGNLILGTGDSDYGPTATTSYLNGLEIPTDGYVVYTLGANNTPIVYSAANANELVAVAVRLGGTGSQVVNLSSAIAYLCGLANTWVMNRVPSNMVNDDLVYYSDASNLSSYPGTGTDLMDLSGDGRDATTANDPTINNAGTGLVFDGVDTEVNIPAFTLSGDFSVTQTLNISNTSPRYGGMPLGGGVKDPAGTTRRAYMWFRGNANEFRFAVNQEVQKVLSVDSALWASKTVQYTAIRDGSNVRFYINGEEVATATGMDTRTITFRQIGASYNYPYYNVDGTIFNTAIYDKALTESEVLQNYYGGSIVTDGLTFATDAGNTVSYEKDSEFAYSLTGSVDGTLINVPSLNISNGGTWEFDGVDQKITFPNNAVFNHTSELTIESWVNFDTNSPDFIFEKGNVNTQYSLFSHGTDIVFRTFHAGDGSYDTLLITKANADITNGVWHHIVGSWDGSTKRIYVDGELKGSQSKSGALTTTSQGAAIGAFGGTSSGYYFGGGIAIVRIYDKGLSPSEVLQNFRAQQARFK